jgi:hypothetical protein
MHLNAPESPIARARRGGLLRAVKTTLAAAISACVLVAGCDQPGYESTAVSVVIKDQETASPQAVTRTALTSIQQELNAIAAHDRHAADQALAKLVALAAQDAIRQRFAAQPVYRMIVRDDEVRGLAELWSAAVAYYADGIQFDRMRVVPGPDEDTVLVLVPAEGPEDAATLRVECLRDPSGRWRVSRIDFAAPGAAPTTAPASAPAAGP